MRKAIYSIFIVFLCCKADGKKENIAQQLPSEASENTVNKEGIALEIYDYEGFKKFLTKKDEKIYVINFWATWCKPCVEELPYFEQLHKNYKDKNVDVILVSLDMPKMIEKQLIPFIKNKKLQAKVVVLDDPKQNTWIPKINKDWSGAIPATIIYNKERNTFFEQSFTYEELENQLLNFLN